MQTCKPVAVLRAIFFRYPFSSQKRWIAYDRVKAAILTREYLRKLDLPMEGGDRVIAFLQGSGRGTQFFRLSFLRSGKPAFHLDAFLFPWGRLVGGEEGRDNGVADDTDRRHAAFQRVMPRYLRRPLGIVRCGLDLSTCRERIRHTVFHELPEQRQRRFRIIPGSSGDLLGCQPDKAVAASQGMIEEREFVILRARREPERQACEIDGTWILVDAIKASLRHEAPRM